MWKKSIITMKHSGKPILLPSPVQRRLEATASAYFAPPPGQDIDFSAPAGEPALTAPDSMSWQVFKNPLVLFVGGIAAVILELAEPRVRTGVWTATTFREDPMRRLRNTGLAAMMTVYGPRSRTEAMIAAVTRRHARISGCTADGTPYRANEPELLDWVYATASFGFLEAYNAYVQPVGQAQRDRFYGEGQLTSRLYGAVGAPTTQRELDALLQRMEQKLEGSAVIFEFIDIMRRAPLLPGPLARMQGLFVMAAIELVPAPIRQRLDLGRQWDLRAWQRAMIRRTGAAADRLILRSCPPVLACRRLGLPDDYLYRQPGMAGMRTN
jgi:uncharacterized protein (DUF2236 family)